MIDLRRGLVALALALAACAPSGRPPGEHVDAAVVVPDTTPAVCYEPSVTGMVMAGAANLQSCAIWNHVAQMNGTVTLARAQDNLTMTFANGLAFAGTISGTTVDLVHSELHDFTDGCTWRATETLSGTIDTSSCVMMVHYAYQETVEVSNGACASPCTGTADFMLQITPIF
jgi:hypothetical protein